MAPIYSIETTPEKASALRELGFDLEEQIADLDTKNWISIPYEFLSKESRLEGKSRMIVNPARTAYCPAVEKVGKELNKSLPEELRINYQNTSTDSLRREFVGDNNWKESLMLNRFLGVKTPNLNEFVDILRYTQKNFPEIYKDIVGISSPLRGEWIDNDFKTKDRELYLHSNHIFDNKGNILKYDSEILDKNTLIEDKQINLIDFIKRNQTSQGLVHKKVKKGNFNYLHPRADNNSVVRFIAGPGWAGLDCSGSPLSGDPSLGERAVRHE